MNDNQRNLLENIEKNGLLPMSKQTFGKNVVTQNTTQPIMSQPIEANIFSTFPHLRKLRYKCSNCSLKLKHEKY